MGKTSEDRLTKAKNYAYRLLAYHSRSCKELTERLGKKGFSKKIIRRIVKDFEDLNYLNDRQFSKSFVENRFSTNPCGRKLIEQELKKKGIEDETINDICEEAFDGNKEHELAFDLAVKKLSRQKNLDRKAKWKKLYGLLGRRGFTLEVIHEVLAEVIGEQ